MIQTLEDLLVQTEHAARCGDIATLADLAPRVAVLAESLEATDAASAHRLGRMARRNLTLLAAAASGVRAAQATLADVLNGPALTTYDARGRKAAIAPMAPARAWRC